MNKEEVEVLAEFVKRVKKSDHGLRINEMQKAQMYNFKHGKGAAVKLLDKYFLDILQSVPLSGFEYNRLERIVVKRKY